MQRFIIGRNEAGQRFDKYLHKVLKEAPAGFLYKMLRKKNITLNGKKASGNEILKEQDEISMFFSQETFTKFSGMAQESPSKEAPSKEGISCKGIREFRTAYESLRQVTIIYEDRDVLILNKPLNVLSQKDTPDSLSVNEWLIGYLLSTGQLKEEELNTFRPSVVNRLDRNTTGLLICGKSLFGLQRMSECVRERTVDKYYLTVVCGKYTRNQDFDGFLWKDTASNKVSFLKEETEIPASLKDSGEVYPVKTGFRPCRHEGELSLISVLLYTGKTHQIRAHLSSMGFPILGDPKYGSKKMNQKYGEKEQLLHAYCLHFPELENMNISGKTVYAPIPETFLKYFPGGEEHVNLEF